MGNTVSGPSSCVPPQAPDGAAPARTRRARPMGTGATLGARQGAGAGTVSGRAEQASIFATAAQRLQGQAQPRTNVISGTQEAAGQAARITVSKVWENPSRLSPDISGVRKGALPSELTRMDFGEALTLGRSMIAMKVDQANQMIDAARANASDDPVVPIPAAHMESAVAIAANLAEDGTVYLQDAEGTYLVQSGDDAGQVRDLPTVIIGFSPQAGVTIDQMDEAGREISRLLRQESVLTELDGDNQESTLIATLSLDPERNGAEDGAITSELTRKFGGTTKIGTDKIAVIVDTGGSFESAQKARQDLEGIVADKPEVTGHAFKHSETRFSPGVRIANPEASRAKFLEATRQKYESRFAQIEDVGQRNRKLNSLMGRAEAAFNDTWQRLFGAGMRPAAQDYIMIDQKSRHLADEDAPMHWSTRAVSLDRDRTAIEALWTSELVLDTSAARVLSADPLVGRGDFSSGTALVKDVGVASPSYASLGSYVVPVSDAALAISQMQAVETESSEKLVKYHTEVPNCLSYALGLLQNSGPLDSRFADALDDVFRDQAARDGLADSDTSARVNAEVANLREGAQFDNDIPGLVLGETNYPRALAFLERISDETLMQPSTDDWAKAFINHAGAGLRDELLDKAAAEFDGNKAEIPAPERMRVDAEVKRFVAELRPTTAQIEDYRAKVTDDFNAGLRYEASGDPKSQGGNPQLRTATWEWIAPRDDVSNSRRDTFQTVKPVISELLQEASVRDLANLPRTRSTGDLSRKP